MNTSKRFKFSQLNLNNLRLTAVSCYVDEDFMIRVKFEILSQTCSFSVERWCEGVDASLRKKSFEYNQLRGSQKMETRKKGSKVLPIIDHLFFADWIIGLRFRVKVRVENKR